MDELTSQLEQGLEVAQKELASAEIGLIEAVARADEARANAARLQVAIAALRGEPIPEQRRGGAEAACRAHNPEDAGSSPAPASNQEVPSNDEERAGRPLKKAPKKPKRTDPLADFKCRGCGEVGTTYENILATSAGGAVRMLVCSDCSNQTMT